MLAYPANSRNEPRTITPTDINAALDGLIYAPTGDYNGAATLTITTDDQGNNGSGGALTDTDTVAITVNAVTELTRGRRRHQDSSGGPTKSMP